MVLLEKRFENTPFSLSVVHSHMKNWKKEEKKKKGQSEAGLGSRWLIEFYFSNILGFLTLVLWKYFRVLVSMLLLEYVALSLKSSNPWCVLCADCKLTKSLIYGQLLSSFSLVIVSYLDHLHQQKFSGLRSGWMQDSVFINDHHGTEESHAQLDSQVWLSMALHLHHL